MGALFDFLGKADVNLEGSAKALLKAAKLLAKSAGGVVKDVSKTFASAAFPGVGKTFKNMKNAFKQKDAIRGTAQLFKGMGQAAMGPVNLLLTFFDKLGIVEPIMNVLNGLLSIFAGTLLKALMPTLKELFQILLSPEVMKLIKSLAELFAALLIPALKLFMIVLKPLLPVFSALADSISVFTNFLMNNMKPVWDAIFGALAWVWGGFVNVIKVGANVIIFIINTLIDIWNALDWLNILPDTPNIPYLAEGGIVTDPTIAMIGDKGAEAVVPLDKGGFSQGDYWQQEDIRDAIMDMRNAILKRGNSLVI